MGRQAQIGRKYLQKTYDKALYSKICNIQKYKEFLKFNELGIEENLF